MRASGIGGQAVLEGVMMRNRDRYAVAVRKPDGEIIIDYHEDEQSKLKNVTDKIPIVRGVVNFVSSLVVGMQTLTYSANFIEVEEDEEEDNKEASSDEGPISPFMMAVTVGISIVLAVVIFMLIPYGLSLLFQKFITNLTVLSLLEGLIRLVIFLIYVWAISLMDDIKRVYRYHGAEHKCINCIEQGRELTVENVRNSSRFHKRCGTSFLLIVMVISILVFACITAASPLKRLLLRLVLIPVVAGISYEFIRLAGRSENPIVSLLSKPGMMLQRLTTKEPDDSMIEVGIRSVEAVFDWKAFLNGVDPQQCIPKQQTEAEVEDEDTDVSEVLD